MSGPLASFHPLPKRMAITATAGRQLTQEGDRSLAARLRLAWPRMGLRSRQIALISALVALVIVVTTTINIASLTSAVVSRTQREAGQSFTQIQYAINQEIARSDVNPYTAVAGEHSDVRALMDATIVSSRPIAYVYITDV